MKQRCSDRRLLQKAGCWVLPLILGISSGAFSSHAADLNQQLDIPLNNGTLSTTREQADDLLRLGKVQAADGFVVQAIQSWQTALKQYQQIGEVPSQALAYRYLGAAYLQLGQVELAEDAFRRQLAIARDRQDLDEQILALNSLGRVLTQRGSLTSPINLFTEALTLANQIGSPYGQALSHNSLGLLAAGLKDYDRALDHYQQAIEASRRASDPVLEANTLNNQGDGYRARQQFRDAATSYSLALRLAGQHRDRPGQYRAIDGLVASLIPTDGAKTALNLLNQRFQLAQSLEDLPQMLVSQKLLAQLYQNQGDYPRAKQAYQAAIAIARSLQDSQQESLLINRLVSLTQKQR